MLRDALSEDNAIRREAEKKLGFAKLRRGYSLALAKRLSRNAPTSDDLGNVAALQTDQMFMPKRLMAGMLLQQFVRDYWTVQSSFIFIPQEDKTQVGVVSCDFRLPRLSFASPFLFLIYRETYTWCICPVCSLARFYRLTEFIHTMILPLYRFRYRCCRLIGRHRAAHMLYSLRDSSVRTEVVTTRELETTVCFAVLLFGRVWGG